MPPKAGKISGALLDSLQGAVARRQHSFTDVMALLARYDVEFDMGQYTFSRIVRGVQMSTTPENVAALERYIGLVAELPESSVPRRAPFGEAPVARDSQQLEELSEVHFHTRRQREALDLVSALLTREGVQLGDNELTACILLLHNEGLDVSVVRPQ